MASMAQEQRCSAVGVSPFVAMQAMTYSTRAVVG